MGGPDLPGIGWAAGLERIALLTKVNKPKIKSITVIPLGDKSQKFCVKIVEQLRMEKIKTNIAYSGNLKKKLQNANKLFSDFVLIIGEEELEKNIAIVKNLNKGEQISIKIENIVDSIKKILK